MALGRIEDAKEFLKKGKKDKPEDAKFYDDKLLKLEDNISDLNEYENDHNVRLLDNYKYPILSNGNIKSHLEHMTPTSSFVN